MFDPKPESHRERQRQRQGELDVVQRWFQAVITHPDGVDRGVQSQDAQELIPLDRSQLEEVILRSKNLTARERINIYANAYYARLVECLGDCFPVFSQALGEEVFHGFAFEYLQNYPSRSYTLDRLGDHFVRFLKETRPDRPEDAQEKAEVSWPDFLIDLATLEWNINQVFDGPGVEQERSLSTADLLAVPAERVAEAKLVPVVCLRLLTFRYPVNAYYTAVRRAGQGAEVAIPEPVDEAVAVTRRDYVVRRYPLTFSQHLLLQSLQKGRAVGESITSVAELSEMDDEELAGKLHSWFQFWTQERFFQSLVW